MSRTSKADAPVSLDEPEIEGRYAELDDYTVAFETHRADVDPASLFRGLPDDRCQCPHWGVVLSGRIIFRYHRAGRVQPDRAAGREHGRDRQEPPGARGLTWRAPMPTTWCVSSARS